MTAAGPWIRVDSGERPEDGEHVLVWFVGPLEQFGDGGPYDKRDDRVRTQDQDVEMHYFTHWARIIEPDTETRSDLATELLSLLDYTETRAESPADVAAVIRQRVGELGK